MSLLTSNAAASWSSSPLVIFISASANNRVTGRLPVRVTISAAFAKM